MNTESLYYCSNCEYYIPSTLECKAHYRSDYHRYNIKRKLLGLNPVNEEVFQKSLKSSLINYFQNFWNHKVTHHVPAPNNKAIIARLASIKKCFLSNGSYANHINSQKHKSNLKQKQIDKKEKKGEKVEMNGKQCLFCDFKHEDIYNHMTKNHGFFIRDFECLCDLDGLLQELSLIIEEDFQCLHCYQVFKSSEGAKQHMIDKGHCFMPEEQYLTFSEFYNFNDKLRKLLIQSVEPIIELDDDSECEEIIIINQKSQQSEQSWQQIEKKKGEQQEYKDLLKKLQEQKAKLLDNGEILLPNGKMQENILI